MKRVFFWAGLVLLLGAWVLRMYDPDWQFFLGYLLKAGLLLMLASIFVPSQESLTSSPNPEKNKLRVKSIIWTLLIIPVGFLALFSGFCDSPYGCNPTPLDFFEHTFLFLSPLFFVAGAVGGWLPESQRRSARILVALPYIPMIIIGLLFASVL